MRVVDKIPPLRLDRHRQSAPQVFDAIRALIIALDLPPGTVLVRGELADHFGLSQTPIRDALMRLAEEGLVDIFPQHATIVSRIDIASALEVHFLRRSIELEILRTLCDCPQAGLQALVSKLRSHLRVQQACLDPLDFAALAEADQAFHRDMYTAAGVANLWSLVCQRSGQIDRLRRLNLPAQGKAQAIVRDHERILEALAARDKDAAESALRDHLSGTLTFVKEIRKLHPEWIKD